MIWQPSYPPVSLSGDRHVQQTRSREVRSVVDAEALGKEAAWALFETGDQEQVYLG